MQLAGEPALRTGDLFWVWIPFTTPVMVIKRNSDRLDAVMTSEIPEEDRAEQQQSASPFEVPSDGVVQPGTAEADLADQIDQATPVPVDDEDEPASRDDRV